LLSTLSGADITVVPIVQFKRSMAKVTRGQKRQEIAAYLE